MPSLTSSLFPRSSTESSSEGLIVANSNTPSATMSGVNEVEERKVSYGIGGAGNIRKPSEPLTYASITHSHPGEGDTGRRRSSLLSSFSSSPPSERRGSLMNIFRRGSNGEETVEAKSQATDVNGGSNMEFRKIDLGGKKKVERQGEGEDHAH